jgi:hypothetical protein
MVVVNARVESVPAVVVPARQDGFRLAESTAFHDADDACRCARPILQMHCSFIASMPAVVAPVPHRARRVEAEAGCCATGCS